MIDPLLIPGSHEAFHIDIFAEGLDPSTNPSTQPATTPLLWGSETLLQMGFILATDTGRILLNGIRQEGHGAFVRITPLYPWKNTGGNLYDRFCNADTLGTNLQAGGRQIAARIRYTAGRYSRGSYCYNSEHYGDSTSNRGALPSEVLFHELVHGYRRVTGKVKKEPLYGGLLRYDNSEEFYAVLLTNIFISDTSNHYKTDLRQDHSGHAGLEAELDSSFGFFQSGAKAFLLVDQFCNDHPDLSKKLAGVKAPFNPLAAIYANRHKARMISQSTLPKQRDLVGNTIPRINSALQELIDPLWRLLGT